jgi:protein-S-isoprenylcysteine O-methyltransferase Ste14
MNPDLLPLFFTHPAAAVLFSAACLAWLVPEAIAMPRQMARISRRGASIQDHRSMLVLIVLLWAGVAFAFLFAVQLPAAAIPTARTALFLIGVICMLVGVVLRWAAIRTLGRYFTRDVAVAADQPVIQAGPYRLIRHPAYSGTLLTMLGLGLALTNWASLVVLILCVFSGHLYRVRVEERALVRTLGQPYVDYMRRTRRFIPYLF